MSTHSPLSELVLRWQELRQKGQAPSADDLCSGCPELVEPLRKEIEALQSMEALLGRGTSGADPAAPRSATTEMATLAVPLPGPPTGPPSGFAGYEILDELGRGGMGVVYRAIQKATKRTVALKVMLQGRFASARRLLRFEREIDLVASLRHPNIVTVYDSGTTADGLPFFAMEYIEGAALDDHLRAGAPKALAEVLALVIKICAAVNYAHQHGVIHRDLKPANIRIDADGEPHILDFGLARTADAGTPDEEGQRATQTGEFLGTLAYASPEQARGDVGAIDIRTDVYSLGVILYQLLTGNFPYPVTGSFPAILWAITATDPEPPSVWSRRPAGAGSGPVTAYRIDDALDAIVLKALTKDRDGRYQSAGALADDLKHYLAGEPIQAKSPGLALLLRLWFRQHFRAALWTVVVGLVCGGLSAGLIGIPRLLPFLSFAANSYARLPSLPRPGLAVDLALPDWALHITSLIGAAAFVGMGLATALLVRCRNRSEDLIAGVGTGLVGGVTAFIISSGWATVMASAVVPSFGDPALIREGYGANKAPLDRDPPAGPRPSDPLTARFPDLADVPESERGEVLYNKMVADVVVGIPRGIWLGVLFTLGAYGAFGVFGTMAAGTLLRGGRTWAAVVLPYLEGTLPAAWLILVLFMQLFFYHGDWPGTQVSGWLIVLLFLALAAIAVAGFLRNWTGPFRAALYAAWAVSAVRLTSGFLPWYVDVLVYALVLAYVGSVLVGRRSKVDG